MLYCIFLSKIIAVIFGEIKPACCVPIPTFYLTSSYPFHQLLHDTCHASLSLLTLLHSVGVRKLLESVSFWGRNVVGPTASTAQYLLARRLLKKALGWERDRAEHRWWSQLPYLYMDGFCNLEQAFCNWTYGSQLER
jgi:hypothetical protein